MKELDEIRICTKDNESLLIRPDKKVMVSEIDYIEGIAQQKKPFIYYKDAFGLKIGQNIYQNGEYYAYVSDNPWIGNEDAHSIIYDF